MTRPHPFDVIHDALSEAWFAEVGEPADRLPFQQREPVQRVLGQLAPGEAAAGAAAEEYGTLLYVVHRFWRAGRPTIALDRAAVDEMLDEGGKAVRRKGGSEDSQLVTVPHGACYLQLPERLFWARIAPDATAEPLDGLFLAAGAEGREVTVLAVLGFRPERGGFSQVAVTAPPEDLARAAEFVRQPLFGAALEGGDRAGVKSLLSEAELLHLASLALMEARR
jgi:hypothetical protein